MNCYDEFGNAATGLDKPWFYGIIQDHLAKYGEEDKMNVDLGFNEDDACDAIRKLWLTMAEKFKEHAINTDDMDLAMKAAGMADKSYWLATGTITYEP